MFMLSQPEGLMQVATVLTQAGIRVTELGKDIFDLRSYYRERVQDKRVEREAQAVAMSSEPEADELNAEAILKEPMPVKKIEEVKR